MEPRVGDKFRLGRKIGSGSFGEIYLGLWPLLFDYVFDWTVLKSQQSQNASAPPRPTFSSSTFLGQSSGSSRQAVVSSSQDMWGSGADQSCTRTTEQSPRTFCKVSSSEGNSPFDSADPRRISSGRNLANTKNYEFTLKGFKGLNFDNMKRIRY
ncbi:hypothetical protein BHE74_00044220 [Ensete ventricosum]|nr:hypothetical protein BHE74_00044220 [Ensete ventricosum]